MRVGPERHVIKLHGLLCSRIGQLLAPVPNVHGKQPRKSIDHLATLAVVKVVALCTLDDGHIDRVVGAVPGEVHPQVLLRTSLKLFISDWLAGCHCFHEREPG